MVYTLIYLLVGLGFIYLDTQTEQFAEKSEKIPVDLRHRTQMTYVVVGIFIWPVRLILILIRLIFGK